MSISWSELTAPNFKVQFYLKSILCLNDEEKYSYEEFLDFPMLSNSDMYFGDSIDENYLYDIEDIDCSGLFKSEYNKKPTDIGFEINFDDSMVNEDKEDYSLDLNNQCEEDD